MNRNPSGEDSSPFPKPSLMACLSAMELAETSVLRAVSMLAVYAGEKKSNFVAPAPLDSASRGHVDAQLPVHDDPADMVSDPGELPSSRELAMGRRELKRATTGKPPPARVRRARKSKGRKGRRR